MEFLTTTDCNGIINTSTLTALRGTGDANLILAETMAISELSPLRGRYDIDAELAKTTTSRNDELIRILVHITAWYLYNQVQDDDIPERIKSNYDQQLKNIGNIAVGKIYSTLTPLYDDDSNPITKYIFGGDDLRDNDIF